MRFCSVLLLLATSSQLIAADKPTAEQLDFFEKTIRPMFLSDCTRCHGEKKQEAGLRLDSPAGIRKGTDKGTILGDVDKSTLIKSVKRHGEFPMPPDKELPQEKVEALVAWVKAGAPMPVSVVQETKLNPKDHWAFKPLGAVNKGPGTGDQAQGTVDRFVNEKLKANNLTMSPRADKRTLIRRAYYDLIGLPPTFEEIEAFEKDASADAFARIVDKLLAMPQYGERWGRHWLDVARYADTKGYVFTEDRNYPYAYTFREYVIRSLNEDKPFNRFVVEQLAADKLELKDKRDLAAMGFLTVGRRFSNNIHDIIDDRIDLVGRGLMGLSIGCARCHDHKFDPVPIADYYSLYGVFQSSFEPKELPLIGEVKKTPELIAFEAELEKKEKAAADFEKKMYADALAPFKKPDSIATMLLATKETERLANDKADKWAVEQKIDPRILERWRNAVKGNDAIFGPWRTLAAKPITPELLKTLKGNSHVIEMLRESQPTKLADVAIIYGELLSLAITNSSKSTDWQALNTLLVGPEGVLNPPNTDIDKLVLIATKRIFRSLRNEAMTMRAKSPLAPPRAMVMNDNPRPTEPVVFLRGSPNNRGSQVPRRMPELLAGKDRKPFANGSGRLEMANAIVDPANPLTPRVIVNRVWMWHFGQGLVRTPSDFGLRTDPPTHPELLDWLAKTFITEDGWSLKKLHRRIMLSESYQQSSLVKPELAKADPENRWLSHFSRHRLDFEGMRDSLLVSAGTLDRTIGGRSVNLFTAPYTTRRSVYGFVDRQNLPGTFQAFDFASPEQHTPQRFQTTVPQQALFLMNSPFAIEQAKAAAARTSGMGEERVKQLYRTILSRNPTTEEQFLASEYVAQQPTLAWEQLAQVLLLSNEFAFVD